MKRALLLIVALLAPQAWAQSWSTQQISEYQKALSNRTRFGLPRYATASLPTCSAGSNTGAIAYDTTADTAKICMASGTWTAVGGGGLTIGGAVTGGGANRVLFEDGSQNLAADADFTYANDVLTLGVAGAATNQTLWTKTMSGGSATSNFLSVTGTTPATLTAPAYGVSVAITGAGSSAQEIQAFRSSLAAGYTGATSTYAGYFSNVSAGTGSNLAQLIGNNGLQGFSNVSTAGLNMGGSFFASNAGAGSAAAVVATSSQGANSIGVVGLATNGTTRVGGYFGLNTSTPTFASAALIADNGAIAADIFVARDNGTPVVTIADGGATTFTQTAAAPFFKSSLGELALNADYTNATAGFTNTALSTTVTSGLTYNFTLVLLFQDSTAADGAQFDFNGGAATVTNFRAHCLADNAAGGNLVITNAATTALATAVQVTLALTTQTQLVCNGTFVPSSSSTFIVRAAQTAHTTGTLTVDRGSWLSIRVASAQ